MEKIFFADNHAEHNADFVFHQPNGHDCWLLILTKTPAVIQVKGQMKRYGKNHAVLFQPGQPIKYAACAESYINGWIRFNLNPSFFDQDHMEYNVPLYMQNYIQCHHLMQIIANEHNEGNAAASLYLLKALLSMLNHSQANERRTVEDKLFNLHQEMECNPGFPWTTTYMSNLVNLSEGYFHRMYKKMYGRSCMDDVITLRISLAQSLLRTQRMKINEVASQCGYKNAEHFCRQFRDRLGMSPNQYQSQELAAHAALPQAGARSTSVLPPLPMGQPTDPARECTDFSNDPAKS